MGAVGNHVFLHVHVHLQDGRSIVHAGVPVYLPLVSKEERGTVHIHAVGELLYIGLKGGIRCLYMVFKGVVAEAQGICRHFHGGRIQHGGKAPHGLYEAGIAVYLKVHVGDYAVIGRTVLIEGLVFVRNLL